MKRFWAVTCAVFVSSAVALADDKDKTENLLVNGSFEEGEDPDQFKPLEVGSKVIKGWEVTRGGIDYIGTYWKHADGKRSLDLNGSPGVGGVKQAFKTKKGQKYQLTLALAGNAAQGGGKKKIGVKVGDEETVFEFDATGKSTEDMGWEKKTWIFTAAGDETALEIYSASADDESCGPALDNVAVVPAKN